MRESTVNEVIAIILVIGIVHDFAEITILEDPSQLTKSFTNDPVDVLN
jgi:hypothetical protein